MSRGIFYRIPRVSPGDDGYQAYSRCAPKWTLTISGVTMQTVCSVSGGGVLARKVTAGTINGTFTVEREAGRDHCRWEFSESPATSVTITDYTNATCTTGATVASAIGFVLDNDGSQWSLTISANGGSALLFSGTLASQSGRTITNSLAAGSYNNMGYGGSATFEEGCA